MTTKKRNLFFETPPAEIPVHIRDMMDRAERRIRADEEKSEANSVLDTPLEVDFKFTGDKFLYSMGHQELPRVTARFIVKAINEYDLEPVDRPPVVRARGTEVGTPEITYERGVLIMWSQKKILTNFKPQEGDMFIRAMAVIVQDLQGPEIKTKEEKPS